MEGPAVNEDVEVSSSSSEPQAEFTLRAVSAGVGIGVLLCFTNTYFGLQSGWVSMMSLQASLLGFAVFKFLPFTRGLSVHENIVVQSTATATGTLPLAAGLVGIVPALAQLSPSLDNSPPIVLSPSAILAWCTAVAFFGCFLAVPLRRQVIVREKLVFPSGTATAQIIGMLHDVEIVRKDDVSMSTDEYERIPTSEEAIDVNAHIDVEDQPKLERTGWKMLWLSFVSSIAFTLLSIAYPVVYAVPIFNVFGNMAHDWLWWFTPSFSYIGQGIIMGFHTTVDMNIGMLCGWAFLSPLAKKMGWAPGWVGSTLDGSRGWIIWPALAIMTAESILSLAIVTLSTISRLVGPEVSDTLRSGKEDDEPDSRIVVGGALLSCLVCVLLVGTVFGSDGIRWWATVIALILASIFSILGVRALGETDLNPVSAIGKLSQLIFAIIQPHNIVANLVAGGISEAGAQQAGDLMQDLKTGHLHDASPRAQFQAQLVGSTVGVVVSSGVYLLYRNLYELPSTAFPVPSASIWLNLARLVNTGQLPPGSKATMLLFGCAFVVLAAFKVIAVSRREKPAWLAYVPSGISFSIGFLNTPSFSIARFLGGIISLKYGRDPKNKLPLIIIASGFVLGEGLGSILGLAVKSAGGGPLSCWGCNLGGGGYCSNC